MRAAVDCHMVGQPEAGDAGNARFHAQLTHALAATAAIGDDVIALVAHTAAGPILNGSARLVDVPASNFARLGWGASSSLASEQAQAGIFSYVTPLRAPCPLLVVVHDLTFRLHPGWFSPRVRALLGAMVPRSVRNAARVITVSETSKADLVATLDVDPDRISIVSNVPAPAFTPRVHASTRVWRQFALDRYCLYVGDVHPRKNLAGLADAVKLLGDPHLELAVVGRAGHRGTQIIEASGGRWLGPLGDDDLADLYTAAAVTCYPSLYEGFGLPVVEAMACGSPVVASNRGAIPEVAGDAAVLVEPTAAGIAEGLRAALEPAMADHLRAKGLRRATMFTPRDMGEAAWDAIRMVT